MIYAPISSKEQIIYPNQQLPQQQYSYNIQQLQPYQQPLDANFLEREAQYNLQISQMNDKLLEQATLINKNEQELQQQNRIILEQKKQIQNQSVECEEYKQTLKQLYMKYVNLQKSSEQSRLNNADLVIGIDSAAGKNLELNNELRNALEERNSIIYRKEELEKKSQFNIQNLTAQLNDKIIEINDLRRRVNDLLDLKRRLEEEVSSLRFNFDNLNNKFDSEIREKNIKMEQMDRSFQETLNLKIHEINDLLDLKMRIEIENSRLVDQNTNLAHELATMAREIRIKEEEIFGLLKKKPEEKVIVQQKLQHRLDHNGAEHLLELQKKYNNKLLKQLTFKLWMTQQQLNQQTEKNKQLLKLTQRTFPQDPTIIQNPLQQSEHSHTDQIDGKDIPQIPQVSSGEQIQSDTQLKKDPSKDSQKEKSTKNLQFSLENNQNDQNEQQGKIMKREPSKDKNNKNQLLLSNNDYAELVSNKLVVLVTFVRESINNLIFELFVRSINHANQKKMNSLILFIINIKELREKYWKGLTLSLEVHQRLKIEIKDLIGSFQNNKSLDHVKQKLSLSIGKISKKSVDHRDNTNKWIQDTISITVQKKMTEMKEQNRDFLFLFRLLTIKYRIKYPLSGKPFSIDLDLESYLDSKICQALRQILNIELE